MHDGCCCFLFKALFNCKSHFIIKSQLTFFKQECGSRCLSVLVLDKDGVLSSIIGKCHGNFQLAFPCILVIANSISVKLQGKYELYFSLCRDQLDPKFTCSKSIPVSSSEWNSTLLPVNMGLGASSDLALKENTASLDQLLNHWLLHKERSNRCSNVHRDRAYFRHGLLFGFNDSPCLKNTHTQYNYTKY